MDSRGNEYALSSAKVEGCRPLPDPPTAVIQALNKQAAPERFTEGDARAIRTLAPAIAAGSRLILSILNCSRDAQQCAASQNGEQRAPLLGRTIVSPAEEAPPPCPEEVLLLKGVRRAQHGLGASRARLYVLDWGAASSQLQLWIEHPLPSRSDWAKSSSKRFGHGGSDDGARLSATSGLQGVALTTGRAVRSGNALSDSLYNHDLDMKEGFLARSVIYVPLFPRPEHVDEACSSSHGAPLGVLQLAIGRGELDLNSGPNAGNSDIENGDLRGVREEDDNQTKKTFMAKDEPLAETFAEEIAGLLSHLRSTGFRPRTSATTLAGDGRHVGAGFIIPPWGPEIESKGSAISELQKNEDGVLEVSRGNTKVSADREIETTRRWGLHSGRMMRSPSPDKTTAFDEQPPVQRSSNYRFSSGDDVSGIGPTAPRRMANGELRTVAKAEVQGSVVRGPLGRSIASTVAASLHGRGVRASVATAGLTTPLDSLLPPSPATEDSHGGSLDRCSDQEGHISEDNLRVAGASNSISKIQTRQQGKPTAVIIEVTQARSWATAHGVLQACKEGLAAEKRLWQGVGGGRASAHHSGECNLEKELQSFAATATNTVSIAPAICSLVSSLLPGCTAVLLLLDNTTGCLREAQCDSDVTINKTDDQPHQISSLKSVRREDVAHRALASGKALLAQVGDGRKEKAEEVYANRGGEHDANGNIKHCSDDHGERVFCIPVCASEERKFGVLQLFLPPALLYTTASQAELELEVPFATPRERVESGKPPSSFFMATKIMADSIGLALSWCEALDRQKENHAAETTALSLAGEVAAKAHDQNRIELEAKREKDLRAAEELHATRMSEAANAHARAIESILEGKEALAAAAAKAVAQAKERRNAARVLIAWCETSKRITKGEENASRMDERRRALSFCEWRCRTSVMERARKAEGAGVAALNRRGLRQAVGLWARAASRGRYMKERRLAGVRLIAKMLRRNTPTKKYFGVWKVAAREVFAARQALAQNNTEEEMKALAVKVNFITVAKVGF